MRKLVYGAAVSLDLYLAGKGEAMDWLLWSDDAAAVSAASWAGVDVMLLGRKTYEHALRHYGSIAAPEGVTSFVFSRTLSNVAPGAELVSGDAAEFVRRLKAGSGGDILVMGGGELGSALIDAGLVDEIGFNVHPLLLGGGTPAVTTLQRRVELRLVEARPMERGCVLVRYAVGG